MINVSLKDTDEEFNIYSRKLCVVMMKAVEERWQVKRIPKFRHN
jgi:hypothetical protein